MRYIKDLKNIRCGKNSEDSKRNHIQGEYILSKLSFLLTHWYILAIFAFPMLSERITSYYILVNSSILHYLFKLYKIL